jgi:hypothetical protein
MRACGIDALPNDRVVPFMVRQAHHERSAYVVVRFATVRPDPDPELDEGSKDEL